MPNAHHAPTRRGLIALLAAAAAMLPAISPARADGVIFTPSLSDLAIRGYDPVAYFTDSKPVKGDKQYAHQWMGAEWRFASAANRDRFIADPEAFAPQYGGYCAWAVSQGYTASTDPEAWAVVDGRLYLNYDADVQAKWQQDVPGLISQADANWPEIRAELE